MIDQIKYLQFLKKTLSHNQFIIPAHTPALPLESCHVFPVFAAIRMTNLVISKTETSAETIPASALSNW